MLVNFLKGTIIGITNVIPGVSGGTMALIMGIYDKLADSIGNFITNGKKRKEYIIFLSTIFIGAVIGILMFAKLFSRLIESNLTNQPTYLFITGLIIGSIPFVFKLHNDMKPNIKRILLLILGVILVVIPTILGNGKDISDIPNITATWYGIVNFISFDLKYNLWLMICGFIASFAMVLPGISGSALLVSLGEYGNVLRILDDRLLVPAIFVGVGIILGIFACAKIITILLKKYASETYYVIIGLMLASIYQIYVEIDWTINHLVYNSLISVLMLVLGFCTSYFLSRVEKR